MNAIMLMIRIKRRFFAWVFGYIAKILLCVYGVRCGKNIVITYPPYIFKHRGSEIKMGNGVRMHGSLFQNPVCGGHKMVLATYSTEALIAIDDFAALSCSIICAYQSVKIGKYVQIGAGCQITDTDFHPLKAPLRRENNQITLAHSSPVVIEDDVWLGAEVMVLKGVTIGRGSVIAARSVVTKDVPEFSLVAGSPAKVIRNLQ